jgi:hypothetical protein
VDRDIETMNCRSLRCHHGHLPSAIAEFLFNTSAGTTPFIDQTARFGQPINHSIDPNIQIHLICVKCHPALSLQMFISSAYIMDTSGWLLNSTGTIAREIGSAWVQTGDQHPIMCEASEEIRRARSQQNGSKSQTPIERGGGNRKNRKDSRRPSHGPQKGTELALKATS